MGKSTLLENMAVQDIQSGEGLAFIDPHGKTAELLLNYVPEHRIKDVVYFAPFDTEFPISFNVMEDVGYDKRHLVVSGLMSTFKKIWEDAWSARMEYILSNTLLALLEYPGATLLGVNKMYSDKEYRKKVVANISDPSVKSFWVDEFAKYTDKFAAEATPAIQNKIGQFTNNPLIRNIIGQPKSSFDIRKMMDERKIMIINLSKGRVGESNANLLGSMLITKIYLAAMSRADVSDKVLKTLPQFYLYVDEFQSFANESFADILSEARKYKLNLTIAHQYIEQMSEEVRAAVFGNVGTMIAFRVGSTDAEVLEKEFAPKFVAEDIVNLGMYQIYLRLMIDGMGSQPFSATGMPPIPEPAISFKEQVVQASRAGYGQIRATVEEGVRMQTLGSSAEIGSKAPQAAPAAPVTVSSTASQTSRPVAPQQPMPLRIEQRRDVPQQIPRQSELRRDVPQPPRPRPVPPPADVGDGFQSFDALKAMVPPRQASSQGNNSGQRPDNRQNGPRREERKGITPESRNDLKQALAAIIKPAAPMVAPTNTVPMTAPVQQKVAPAPKVQGEQKEVPEEVLKKLLDM
jgi:hypothetical protein